MTVKDIEKVRKRVANIGYTLDEQLASGKYKMRCALGHSIVSSWEMISHKKVRCLICEGVRLTPDTARSLLKGFGFTLVNYETHVDSNLNTTVLAGLRVAVSCETCGKVTKDVTIRDIKNGFKCNHIVRVEQPSGFSRSEEIIAKVLDHNKINFIREYPVPKEYIPADLKYCNLDFYLPELNMVIEYDGDQHVYGRSDKKDRGLEAIQRGDAIRDSYAKHIGAAMIRIPHKHIGKGIVFALSEHLSDYVNINPLDSVYDDMVRGVFNYAAKKYNWVTYEDAKDVADYRLDYDTPTTVDHFGIGHTTIHRYFKWVYGMGREEYRRYLKYNSAGNMKV